VTEEISHYFRGQQLDSAFAICSTLLSRQSRGDYASQLLPSYYGRLAKVLETGVSVRLSSGWYCRNRNPFQVAAGHVNKRLQPSLRMAPSNGTITEKEYGRTGFPSLQHFRERGKLPRRKLR
jgi:hypothetical protein